MILGLFVLEEINRKVMKSVQIFIRVREIYPNGEHFIYILGSEIRLCFDSLINYTFKILVILINSFLHSMNIHCLVYVRHCARTWA